LTGNDILTTISTPFKQAFSQYEGVFVALAILCIVLGFGLGRALGGYRRRVLEERLKSAKDLGQRSEADGRRYAELLGVTAKGTAPLARLSNSELRAKAETFAASLRAQLVAWKKEIDGRFATWPTSLRSAETDEQRNSAWGHETRQLLVENSARLATYQDRFKVDAVMLRMEISRRLGRPPERTQDAATRVAAPVSLSRMAEVATDLDALAKLLPDDGAPRAQRDDRGRRARVRG